MALSVAGEICLYLQTLGTSPLNYNGVGTVNLFDTFLPDTPDLAASVSPRPGVAPVSILTGAQSPGIGQPRLAFARPRVQVQVRSPSDDFDDGNALMNAIFGDLHGLNERILNVSTGTLFHWIEAVQSPAYLGQMGGRERHLWTVNFSVWWEDPALAS